MNDARLLQTYIDTVHNRYFAEQPLALDERGQVVGRFFKCIIGSRFEPIQSSQGDSLIGVEARLDSRLITGLGLPAASLFSLASSDEALARLDRLSRIIHTLNHAVSAYRHLPLYLNVHPRLPVIVKEGHGEVFETLLGYLDLSPADIVIELPASVAAKPALSASVISNYRRHGFRVASSLDERSLEGILTADVKPDLLKLPVGLAMRQVLSPGEVVTAVPVILKDVRQSPLPAMNGIPSVIGLQGPWVNRQFAT
ncbi:EAL domain-containing protein [Leeia oryzae]|uniref:EAL domain-containing protein n=1 Tax=Leeia oryzae TaxID=356662 RepID=UPI000381C46E|nr:EAL domain-containing protein [Leeia oryzae]